MRKTVKWPVLFARTVTVAMGLAALNSGDALAHPFHVSIAEVEVNRKTKSLEWAVRVHPVDLENAVRRLSHEPIDVEESDDADRWITSYLEKCVRVIRPDGRRAKMKYVGKEISTKYAWLYFEFAGPFPDGSWKIQQAMFFEFLKDQVNTVTFKQGERRSSLHCTRSRPVQSIELPVQSKKRDD